MGFFDSRRKVREQGNTSDTPAGPSTSDGQPRFAVLDVETTGLSAKYHRVLEIAIVTTDPWGRPISEWSTLINPQGPVGPTSIHGIKKSDVANAPLFADVIGHLNGLVAGAAVVSHNARFDLAFLRAEYERAGWDIPRIPSLCTLQASQYHLPGLDRRRLADCCWAVGTPLRGAHSALGDARATAGLLAAFMNPHVGYPPLSEHLALPGRARGVSWPTGPTRRPLDPEAPTPPSQPGESRAAATLVRNEGHGIGKTLVELVERFSLVDALDEGAPTGAIAYLEKLAEVLEDGQVTSEEAADIADVAESQELTPHDIAAANQSFVLALAHAALEDGKVSRAERAELLQVSDLLGVNPKAIPALLDQAEHARQQRMSADLAELPAEWEHGDPLRVGDKVVFTGCDETQRARLESESERLGVRVVGAVSAKTAMLISDGAMDGTKAAKAREVGTRVVHPQTYAVLLAHLQPALARETKALPRAPKGYAPRHAIEATPADS